MPCRVDARVRLPHLPATLQGEMLLCSCVSMLFSLVAHMRCLLCSFNTLLQARPRLHPRVGAPLAVCPHI